MCHKAATQGYFFSIWNIFAVFQVSSMCTTPAALEHCMWFVPCLLTTCSLQIVSLVLYLPLLAAFFDEPSQWSVYFWLLGQLH